MATTTKRTAKDDPLTEQEMLFAAYIRKGRGLTLEQAATRVKMSLSHAKQLVGSARYKSYQEQYTKAFNHELAAQEAREFMQFDVSRASLVAEAIHLSRIPVADTRGVMTGQVSALSLAVDISGFRVQARSADDFFKGRSEEELEFYHKHGRFPEDPTPPGDKVQ